VGGCYIWYAYSEEGTWRGRSLYEMYNSRYPSTASVLITVLYNGPLFCCFNVPVKGVNMYNDSFRPPELKKLLSDGLTLGSAFCFRSLHSEESWWTQTSLLSFQKHNLQLFITLHQSLTTWHSFEMLQCDSDCH